MTRQAPRMIGALFCAKTHLRRTALRACGDIACPRRYGGAAAAPPTRDPAGLQQRDRLARRAEEAGIVSQRGNANEGVAATGDGVGAVLLLAGVAKRIPASAHAPTQDEHLRVDEGGDDRHGVREVVGEAVAGAQGLGVVRARGLEDGERVGRVGNRDLDGAGRRALLAIEADEAAGARILLEAAAAAAAAGFGFAGVYVDVAGFPARAVRSNDNLSVNDDAGAHARAERKHDGDSDTVARSEPGLSKRRGVRVVERVGAGTGEGGLEGCGQTGEIKNDVGGHGQRAVLEDDAGDIDADGAERLGVLSRLAHEVDSGGGDPIKRLGIIKLAGWDLRCGEDFPAPRHDAHLDARTADIEADNCLVRAVRCDRIACASGVCHGSPFVCVPCKRVRLAGPAAGAD